MWSVRTRMATSGRSVRVHTSLDEISAVVAELLGTNRRIKSWWVGRRVRRLLHEWDHAEQALLRSIDKSGE